MTAWVINTDYDDEGGYKPEPPAIRAVPTVLIKRGGPDMVKDDKPNKPVKVRVSDKWSVAHDGKRYVKGDTVTVPEATAQEWELNHWVERVTTKSG